MEIVSFEESLLGVKARKEVYIRWVLDFEMRIF